ncbi:G2/mitotic-specific cyclin S13-6 [Morus notabilis]|uniref:B-like cyclin n=1 Tax=Morus notabilis TaxID=981085 RepID=W9QU47_9ROSA|nr:G2/mitotic-specific cyclin S13-7 [Morus notabilis]EXB54225.1 G2/mitotic-specific cyclin S13-6 [Morus notabilis]
MASRVVVPQQARSEAVVGGENKVQKKNVAADGRNRRALGDIGNMVTVRPNDAKPHRPITRSFRAQLIANAEAAKAVANNKKQACVNVNGSLAVPEAVPAGQKRDEAVPKPVHKRANLVKPKPQQELIEVSSDSDDDAKKKNEIRVKKKDGEGASRKKAPTLSSVLTARSKMACGITNKPKENIVDIDAADINNELAAVEYVEDMYKFYKLAENASRPHDYIDSQPELNEQMRAILVDWLVEVHIKFELSPETFYLTINIVDRFLAVKTVPRKELQLVGISAMLMASKYEEIWAPEVNDFVCLADRAYTHEQILKMEKIILGKLEWTLTVPTAYVFLVRFIKASVPNDREVENLVYFLAELGIMHYATIMYCPSMIAASAVYAARSTLNKSPVWNDTLKLHTGYSEAQVIDCAKLLAILHSTVLKSKLRAVYRKYSSSERGCVAMLPVAKALLPAAGAGSI